jgi:hypothetical protein
MVKYIARKWRNFTEQELKDCIQPVFLASRQRRPLPLPEISKITAGVPTERFIS